MSDGEKWIDCGQFKGDTGATGAAGKSAYLHVKYANSLNEDDWSENDGETPSTYIGIYTDDNPEDQLVWSLYQWKKWTGEDGLGYEYIYKRTTTDTAPETPTETSQEDGFVPDGWTDSPTGVDNNNRYEWIAYRKKIEGVWSDFIGRAGNPTIAALWAKFGQQGAAGTPGNYTEYRFAINGSTTTPPSIVNNSLNPSGWTTEMPAVSKGYYLWVTKAIKSGDGSSLISTWSTPVRMTPQDGADGKDGRSPALVFRGIYDSTKDYYGNENRVDCVQYSGAYYIARIDAGIFKGIAPTNTSKWNTFGASFESVATDLLLAENANIANLIFRNERLESSTKNLDGRANIIIDGKNGVTYFDGSIINPFKRIKKENLREYMIVTSDALGFKWLSFDFDKTGLKIMVQFTRADIIEIFGDDTIELIEAPQGTKYLNCNFEIFNGSEAPIGLTGNFCATRWDEIGQSTSLGSNSVTIQPYEYHKYKCFPMSLIRHYPTGTRYDTFDGFTMPWIIEERKQF